MRAVVAIWIIVLCVAGASPTIARPIPASDEGLFVQVAPSARYANGRLYLDNVQPSTVYFTERPARQAGTVDVERFVRAWGQGSGNFKDDPPNASVTFSGTGGEKVAVVELSDPALQGSTLSYRARLLEGALPPSFARVSLFIDPGGLMCLVCGCCN